MNKIRLEIVGLSYSQTQSGAYALILSESSGSRRLPIIIGGFEAQAIAIELEKMIPTRPLTHDLFKTFADSFEIQITEVFIYNLSEGIFYAKILCEQNGKVVEIDARTSDAIAIGIRFTAPIYTTEEILSSAGMLIDDQPGLEDDSDSGEETKESGKSASGNPLEGLSVDELQNELSNAIDNEDYELASKIRDEIKKRSA